MSRKAGIEAPVRAGHIMIVRAKMAAVVISRPAVGFHTQSRYQATTRAGQESISTSQVDVVRIICRLAGWVLGVGRAGNRRAAAPSAVSAAAMAVTTAAAAAAQDARLVGDRPVIDRVVRIDVPGGACNERSRRTIEHRRGLAAPGRPGRR